MIDVFGRDEFEQALPDGLWEYAGVDKGEHIYTISVFFPKNGNRSESIQTNKRIIIRSSIDVRTGKSGDVGQDSIRHWIEYSYKGKWFALGKGSKEWTTRVPGWEKRLVSALRELYGIALTDSRNGRSHTYENPEQPMHTTERPTNTEPSNHNIEPMASKPKSMRMYPCRHLLSSTAVVSLSPFSERLTSTNIVWTLIKSERI